MKRATRTTRLLRGAALALIFGSFGAAAQTAQGPPNAMQGFSQNRDKPIQIDAATLEVRDKDRVATFSGDVKVVQGDTTMRSKSLMVFYDQEAPKGTKAVPAAGVKSTVAGPAGNSQIRRLEAKGGVIVTQKDQTVTGESGVFDMKANTVTMLGGVVMTQGQNVLRGDRLVVNLTTGISRVEMGQGGRVQGIFQGSKSDVGKGTTAPPAPGNGNPPKDAGKPLRLNAFPANSARPG